MSRISMNPPRTLTNRLFAWFAKRKFGRELGPVAAAGHHRRVLMTTLRLEMGAAKWNTTPPSLRLLGTMRSAATIECEWCMDFGYWLAVEEGMDADKIESVPNWRNADCYTPVERAVLEYAEAMTQTPPEVTDELNARLREHLDDAQLVEITATIALENFFGRNNHALGMAPDGFKESCAVPARKG